MIYIGAYKPNNENKPQLFYFYYFKEIYRNTFFSMLFFFVIGNLYLFVLPIFFCFHSNPISMFISFNKFI